MTEQRTRSYHAPKLECFGTVTALTAGGSGPITEADAGNMSMNNMA